MEGLEQREQLAGFEPFEPQKAGPSENSAPCSCGGGRGRGETLARSAGWQHCPPAMQVATADGEQKHCLSSHCIVGVDITHTSRTHCRHDEAQHHLHHREVVSVANTRWVQAVAPAPVLVLADVNSLV